MCIFDDFLKYKIDLGRIKPQSVVVRRVVRLKKVVIDKFQK